MTANEKYFRETELRKVDPRDVHALAEKLDLTCDGDGGKTLMGVIPKDYDPSALKYKQTDIFCVQKAAETSGGKLLFTEILFDEWGSSGRKRPNVGLLLKLLVDAELWQGADFVAEEWLHEPPPARPSTGPAAAISINLLDIEADYLKTRLNSNYPETDEINFNANHLPDSMAMGNNVNRFVKYQRIEKKIFDHSDSTAVTAETPKPPPRQRTGRRQQQEQQVRQQSAENINKISEDDNALQPYNPENQHHEQLPTSEQFNSDYDTSTLSCLMQNSANTEATNLSETSSIPPTKREQTISMSKPQCLENHHHEQFLTSNHFDSDLDISTLPKFDSLMPNSANTESTNLSEASSIPPINREQIIPTSNSKEITTVTSENLINMSDLTENIEEQGEKGGYDDSLIPDLAILLNKT